MGCRHYGNGLMDRRGDGAKKSDEILGQYLSRGMHLSSLIEKENLIMVRLYAKKHLLISSQKVACYCYRYLACNVADFMHKNSSDIKQLDAIY